MNLNVWGSLKTEKPYKTLVKAVSRVIRIDAKILEVTADAVMYCMKGKGHAPEEFWENPSDFLKDVARLCCKKGDRVTVMDLLSRVLAERERAALSEGSGESSSRGRRRL